MGGGNQRDFSRLQPSGQHGGNADWSWEDFIGVGYHHPYFSIIAQEFQRAGWQAPGNTSSYMPRPQRDPPSEGMDGYHGGGAPDPGILVYDNVVTGDPGTVMIGEGNRARGQVRGKISGNRIFRS